MFCSMGKLFMQYGQIKTNLLVDILFYVGENPCGSKNQGVRGRQI